MRAIVHIHDGRVLFRGAEIGGQNNTRIELNATGRGQGEQAGEARLVTFERVFGAEYNLTPGRFGY